MLKRFATSHALRRRVDGVEIKFNTCVMSVRKGNMWVVHAQSLSHAEKWDWVETTDGLDVFMQRVTITVTGIESQSISQYLDSLLNGGAPLWVIIAGFAAAALNISCLHMRQQHSITCTAYLKSNMKRKSLFCVHKTSHPIQMNYTNPGHSLLPVAVKFWILLSAWVPLVPFLIFIQAMPALFSSHPSSSPAGTIFSWASSV